MSLAQWELSGSIFSLSVLLLALYFHAQYQLGLLPVLNKCPINCLHSEKPVREWNSPLDTFILKFRMCVIGSHKCGSPYLSKNRKKVILVCNQTSLQNLKVKPKVTSVNITIVPVFNNLHRIIYQNPCVHIYCLIGVISVRILLYKSETIHQIIPKYICHLLWYT